MVDVGEVEKRVDLVKASDIPVEATIGGVVIQTVKDLALLSDIIARADVTIPAHCRGKGGNCFALALKAREWGFPVMSVIETSFVVNDRIGWTSQMLHAVVERNAPIKNRLRYEIIGEGEERRCKVWATFKGEDKPHEYTSETLAKLKSARPTKRDGSGPGGSALWDTNPEVQMFYSASRQWARLYCPDVILGAYTPEETEDETIDVTPPSQVAALAQRLKDAKMPQQGFDAAYSHTIIEGTTDDTDHRADGDETATHEAKEKTSTTPDKPAQSKKVEPATRRTGTKHRK